MTDDDRREAITSFLDDSYKIPDMYSLVGYISYAQMGVVVMACRYGTVREEDVSRVISSKFKIDPEVVVGEISGLIDLTLLEECLDESGCPSIRVRGWVKKTNNKPADPVKSIAKRLGYCPIHWVCFYCGKLGTKQTGPDGRVWHADHSYPRALGGDDLPDNMVLTCASCNLSKRASSASEFFGKMKAAAHVQ